MDACQHGNAYMVAVLLAAGADIAAQDTEVMPLYWFTCLQAAFCKHLESSVTAIHVMGGVSAHQCYTVDDQLSSWLQGHTALVCAALYDQVETVRVLLDKPSERNSEVSVVAPSIQTA